MHANCEVVLPYHIIGIVEIIAANVNRTGDDSSSLLDSESYFVAVFGVAYSPLGSIKSSDTLKVVAFFDEKV